MRTFPIAGILAAATVLGGSHADAAMTPTLELSDGLVASTPIDTGSISFGGVTVNGAPVVGSGTQQVLQVDGTVTTSSSWSAGNLVNPVQPDQPYRQV